MQPVFFLIMNGMFMDILKKKWIILKILQKKPLIYFLSLPVVEALKMPQTFSIGSYIVYFWSNEDEPLELIHVHIPSHVLNNILEIVENRAEEVACKLKIV